MTLIFSNSEWCMIKIFGKLLKSKLVKFNNPLLGRERNVQVRRFNFETYGFKIITETESTRTHAILYAINQQKIINVLYMVNLKGPKTNSILYQIGFYGDRIWPVWAVYENSPAAVFMNNTRTILYYF